MEERIIGRLLFLNQQADPCRWLPRDMDRMIQELDQFKPELLEADPAYLSILCRYALNHGRTLFAPQFVSLTYEFPSRLHYRQIRRAFPRTPILSSYGSTETGHILTECEQGHFHQNTRFCHLDFQPLKRSHGEPIVGRILVTTLGNPWVSLLRFDVGDLVRLDNDPCPCGRSGGLTISRILGRVRDLTFTAKGRAVTVDELDRIVGETDTLVTYQAEQSGSRDIIFHYVPATGHTPPLSTMQAGLQSLYGSSMRIIMRSEAAIPTEQSGKFRLARTTTTWNPDDLFVLRKEVK